MNSDKAEKQRKAAYRAQQDAQRKRRAEVRALAAIYPQVEVARRLGISRQRVSRIVGTDD